MKQFLVRRTAAHDLHSIETFEAGDHLGPAVAAEIAEIEGLEPTIFLGSDLADVVASHEHFFSEPPLPHPNKRVAMGGEAG